MRREISIALGSSFRVPGLTALGFEDLAAFAFCAQRVVTFRQDRYNLDLILSYVLVDSKTKEVRCLLRLLIPAMVLAFLQCGVLGSWGHFPLMSVGTNSAKRYFRRPSCDVRTR